MGWLDRRRYRLKLAFKRLDARGRYETLIRREDGLTYVMRGVGDASAIPHDIAHLVVEKALGLDEGFWGTIARGAVFGTMHYRTGKRAPNAARHSHTLLKANRVKLAEAEVFVRLFHERIEQGRGVDCPALREDADAASASCAGTSPAVGQPEIAAIYAGYAEVHAGWTATPVGGTMEMQWDRQRGICGRA